jgi:hypothetical protein
VNLRPDSDSQGCGFWSPGQPGTGVLAMNLSGWRPPQTYRVEDQQPARPEHGNGVHRFTDLSNVPLLRARAALSACGGDGHYECRRCIFFRSASYHVSVAHSTKGDA